MSISNRLVRDKAGKIFIPMNVDGGVLEDNFMNSIKMALLIGIAICSVVAYSWIGGWNTGWVAKFIGTVLFIYFILWVLRKFVFEEEYYYKIYKRMQKNSITTPGLFWDIVSIKETSEGDIMIYSDMKVGVIVKMFRGTVIGRGKGFVEQHYDSLSEFYRQLNIKDYKFVQMNIMEQAGKDPRLAVLEELAAKDSNKNIVKLTELMVNHIKNETRSTLFENDYFLIYTEDVNRLDYIIGDVHDCCVNLLSGNFIGYKILNIAEIIDLGMDIYGVKYFDYTEATLGVFKENKGINNPIILDSIITVEDEVISLSETEQRMIRNSKLAGNRSTREILNDIIDKRNDNKESGGSWEEVEMYNDDPIFLSGAEEESLDKIEVIENDELEDGEIIDF
jgi:hypothetical protein